MLDKWDGFIEEETFDGKISRLYLNPPEEMHKYKDRFVRTITFQVTDDCNLCCSYCYQINKGHHKMDFKTAKIFIDKILQQDATFTDYIDSGNSLGCVIEFIGGEPFLEIDLVSQITDYFIEQLIKMHHPWLETFKISISSNGTLYFDPKVQEYIRKHKNHLSLSISIDGNKKLHDSCRLHKDGTGSYDEAIKAVKHYRQYYKGYIGSKMTLAPENLDYLYEAMVSLFENGYEYVNANCVYENVWCVEDAKKLYQQLKKVSDYIIDNNLEFKVMTSILGLNYNTKFQKNVDPTNWCGGVGNMIALDWKGDIFPCLRYMESSLGSDKPPYIIGNINEGIGQTPESKFRLKEFDNITMYSQSEKKCIDCPVSNGCGWCSALNYQMFGSVNKRATYICDMHKARVLANYYFQNKIYNKHSIGKRIPIMLDKKDALNYIDEKEYNLLVDLSKE